MLDSNHKKGHDPAPWIQKHTKSSSLGIFLQTYISGIVVIKYKITPKALYFPS